MNRPIVPCEWENEYHGEFDPGESWTLKVEHDRMADGKPYVVTVEAVQGDEIEQVGLLICLSPGKAREVAAALLVYAHLAEQANDRRGIDR